MALWVPFLVHRGSTFSACDRAEALVIAERMYGERCVEVRSSVSVKISDEERDTKDRQKQAEGDTQWS